MHVVDAIRKRRAVRTYTDRPVPEEVLDGLLRMALTAPTGGGAQAWSLLAVRDPEIRRELAELIIAGGARYFGIMRPRRDGTSDDEHAEWARGYAEQVLATYRVAPVWVVGLLVPRGYPEEMRAGGHDDDLISLAFAMENLMLAARAEGLGTVPTTAFQRFEKDRLREILDLPAEIDPAILTPLGYPEAFPEGRPPALKRSFRPWRSLVHDDRWGRVRAEPPA
jgi:nitroreductase